MKHEYQSPKNNPNIRVLLLFTFLVGSVYVGLFQFFSEQTEAKTKSVQKIVQTISGDSLSKENITQNVMKILPSRDLTLPSDNSSSNGTSYQESSSAFKFLSAILQVLLNLYRL